MHALDTRKQEVFRYIVESYIATAEPVGSNFLAEKSDLGVSGATIRNEMGELERAGYLTHPHTSAGRVPTEKGYRYYVENIMTVAPASRSEKEDLGVLAAQYTSQRDTLKALARLLAELVHNAVIVAFSRDSVYYTGLSSLFSQPEFRDHSHTVSVSRIFDNCEDQIDEVYNAVGADNIKVMIGSENPFGSACSIVSARVKDEQLIAVMGPVRMDYSRNFGLIKEAIELV